MSDLGDDVPNGRRKKMPFTKRRKHAIISNPSSLNMLTDDALIKLMCTMDIKTLFDVSAVSRRMNDIFRSTWFFDKCVAPKLSPKQRVAALVRSLATEFHHVTENTEDQYLMESKGKTVDGVLCDIAMWIDMNETADVEYDNYDSGDDSGQYEGAVPKDRTERLRWFRGRFTNEREFPHGLITFDFPPELSEPKFVRERVRDILAHFLSLFVRYLRITGVPITDDASSGESWHFEVEVDPFGVHADVFRYSVKSVIDAVDKVIASKYQEIPKEERQSPKKPSSYVATHIAYATKQLQHTMNLVETDPRQSEDPRLGKMCEATMEDARELLEKVRIGETDDEAAIDKLNRIQSRLLECIE